MSTVKEQNFEVLEMKREHYSLIINGQRMDSDSGETFTTYNPATGEAIATVSMASTEDAEKAVQGCKKCF